MLRRAILKVFRASNFRSLRGLTTTPKPHSLIETCWADSSMLAKGVQELAGLSGKRRGSAKKPSLQALERMQATCIWEKEMIYLCRESPRAFLRRLLVRSVATAIFLEGCARARVNFPVVFFVTFLWGPGVPLAPFWRAPGQRPRF